MRMAFQAIFLMSAFCASKSLKSKLSPNEDDKVRYTAVNGGLSFSARCVCSLTAGLCVNTIPSEICPTPTPELKSLLLKI
jgi:hypothetical protein